MNQQHFSTNEIMDSVEQWLLTGSVDEARFKTMFATNFEFDSPSWKHANKEDFFKTLVQGTLYYEKGLKAITHFDPIIKLKNSDDTQFSIIIQYHTKNGCSVWETVLGKVEHGLLTELRSIYDLEETKKAHNVD